MIFSIILSWQAPDIFVSDVMISNLTMHEGDGDDYGYLYHDDSLYHDQWDWGGPLTPLPGFGFFPSRVAQELEHMTQVHQLFKNH